MIAGIGTDIIDIRRIQQVLERQGDRFVRRILTESEYAVFIARGSHVSYMATRFAVKEAAAKALGTGIGKVSFQDIEVTNSEQGAPSLVFHGAAKQLGEQLAISAHHVTISDEKDYAVAFVVLER
ncbi:holo-ACP synthase [Kistimonas asteriae]|uniref:holo-ACP synthase n=1 Tax=Kistimonas asteriae TaxID=517724 RepID=UPI001BABDC29|nr:holo-ACP synthase [Kistimonas asteriae]